MKKMITHGSGTLAILLGGKRFTQDNEEKLNRNYLAVSLLLTVVLLISVGCEKPGDTPAPPVVELATIVTGEVNAISQTTGQSGGHILGDGGVSITSRGICWSTTTNPTITNSKTTVGTDIWIFTSFATGLAAGTTYYVRAYAINSAGTAYGNEISFTTLPVSTNTVTDIDGNTYNTITIGTQVWMSENFKTTHYQNGDEMPYGFSDGAWLYNASNSIGAYTINPNAGQNGGVYGKLYNWFAVVDPRNIAPVGWHVPTETEWTTLTSFLGGSNTAGVMMKEAGLTHWNSPNTGATNSSGFTGLPGGYRDTNGAYDLIGNAGWWWSTTDAGGDEANALGLFTYLDEANIVNGKKNFGTSVRCIKD